MPDAGQGSPGFRNSDAMAPLAEDWRALAESAERVATIDGVKLQTGKDA